MSGLVNVGRPSATTTDIVTKLDVDNDFANASVSQGAVTAQVTTAIAGCASATAVNNALAVFAQSAYYVSQDALLVPRTSVGAPSVAANPTASPPVAAVTGVASLDGSGKIPPAQVPTLGSGYMSGPWGPTATFSANTVSLPVKIADWNIGAAGISFQPMVFMSVLAKATNYGRPVIEVWINSGPAGYGVGTLVARGMGRNFWNDFMTVNVVPVPNNTSQLGGTGYATSYTTWLTAWLIDANSQGVSVVSTNICNAGAFLMRTRA